MNYETSLINAVLNDGDIATAIEQNVDIVFSTQKDVWNWVVDFYTTYGQVPSKDVVRKNFKTFDLLVTESPLQYYIDNAKKESLQQGVTGVLMKATQALSDGQDPGKIISILQNDSATLIRDSGRMKDTNIVDFDERLELLEKRVNDPDDKILGVTSGIGVIDTYLGGWQPGDFIIVMGWTGTGKSWLTRLFAANAWRAGYVPLIISLEMDKVQEEYRMDTILNAGEVFTNTQLTNGIGIEVDDYADWAKETFYGKHPIHLVTSEGMETVDQNFVQAKVDQYKPDLLILDYHNLFDDAKSSGNETVKVKQLADDFKKIALRNRLPVIDVAGVTMDDGHNDRPPELNEISWSKQLSYNADAVFAIHREPGSNIFQVVTRKTRRCSPFAFMLDWNLDSGKWQEQYEIGF